MLQKAWGGIKDNPACTTWLIVLIVVIHAFATSLGWIPNVWSRITSSDCDDNVVNLYIAMLSVSALQASFAGVIVSLGLSAEYSSFRVLRVKGGKALQSNWMSITRNGFISSGFALVATLLQLMKFDGMAVWFFEAAVLFCMHGIIRLLWLFSRLIQLVGAEDKQEQRKKHVKHADR